MFRIPHPEFRIPNSEFQVSLYSSPVTELQPRFAAQPSGSTSIVVLPAEEGLRLDQFLAAATGLSRRAARAAIEAGEVLRDGTGTRNQSRPVLTGEVVQIRRSAAELAVDHAGILPVPVILHEDGWLTAADKPAGVLSQPSERSTADDLSFDRMLLLHLSLRDGRRAFLRMVHRLDRATSGAVLFARNHQALPPLERAWSSGAVDRRYLAVVEGRPNDDELEIDTPIARDPGHEWRFQTGSGGKRATTLVRVVGPAGDGLTMLECRLVTGRTHQVRVHLASIGHPVVGDRLYGARGIEGVARPLLHAASLRLPHPRDGGIIEIESPIPGDMERFLPEQR